MADQIPVTMTFKDNVYCRVLSTDEKLSTTYYVNALCGEASGEVNVYNFGLPGACGSEFTFYYPNWKGKTPSPGDSESLLAASVSATNGWGHANERCFTPA